MLGFAWMFWLIPLVIFLMMTRHRRHARWSHRIQGPAWPRLERELDEQRDYVDGLERRVVELEERLDFTERLLATRNPGASNPV